MRNPVDIRTLTPDGSAELEARIDSAIDEAARRSWWPAKVAIRGESLGVVTDVMRKYRLEGWKIDRIYDQRDGDFIQIEAP